MTLNVIQKLVPIREKLPTAMKKIREKEGRERKEREGGKERKKREGERGMGGRKERM